MNKQGPISLSTGLGLCLLCLFAALSASAQAPSWWNDREVLDPQATADDYAAVNQGQLKHLATQAAAEMNAKLPGGAGEMVNNLIVSWQTAPGQGIVRDDYAAVNLGQAKALAKLFYDRLIELELAEEYPWSDSPIPADDYALANIGQVKYLFSFEIPEPPPPEAPLSVTAEWTSQESVQVSWQAGGGGSADTYVIQRQTEGGSWETVATVGGDQSAWQDSSVTHGTNYHYRVSASNAQGNSTSTQTAGGGTGGGGTTLPDLSQQPEGDWDGDGVNNSEDQYPFDARRSQDVAVQSYAAIDISGTTPGTSDVDLIALDDEGKAAFAYREGTGISEVLKVQCWENGELELKQTIALSVHRQYETFYEGESDEEQIDVRANNWASVLLPSGKVYGSGVRVDYDMSGNILHDYYDHHGFDSVDGSPFYFWANHEAPLHFDHGVRGDVWDAHENGYINNMDWYLFYDELHYEDGGYGLGAPSEIRIGNSSTFFWRFYPTHLNELGWALGYDTYTGLEEPLPYGSNPRLWRGTLPFVPLEGRGVGLNEAGTVITRDDEGEEGWLLRADETQSIRILDLLPEEHRQQIRKIAPRHIGNADPVDGSYWVTFGAENLEGTGQGEWVPRDFALRIKPAQGSNPQQVTVHRMNRPDGWEWEWNAVWNFGSDRVLNRSGMLAGLPKKTQDENGDPIPTAQQKKHAVLLVPMDLRTRNQATGREEMSEGVVSASDPTPEVEMTLTSAQINAAGALVVEVEGRVKDALSEVLSTGRVQSLRFKVDGQEIGSPVSLDYENDTTSPLRLADSETTFTRTLTIPNPLPRAYTITAETDANAAGNKGWDKIAVGIDIEHRAAGLPGDPGQLSIAFDQPLSSGTANTAKIYFGNRAPASGDGELTETGADTWTFTGTLKVGTETADCTLVMRPSSSTAGVDFIEAKVEYTLPNKPTERVTGIWNETGASSLRFYPDGYALGTPRKFINHTAHLPGSQVRSFEPLVMSIGASDAWVESDGFKIKVGEEEHTLKKFTYRGIESYYVVKNSSASRPKIFVPSSKNLPAEVKVDGGGAENDAILWAMTLGGTDHELTETLVVADQQPFSEELLASAFQSIPPSRLWVSNGGGGTAPSSNGMDWQQPGDTISMKDLIDAYKFIYPDELSQHLLTVYLAENHNIALGDVLGDYNFDYWSLPGNAKAVIHIEHDDGDMHPGIAAQYLWIGLNEALANVADYRAAVFNGAGNIDVTVAAMQAWRTQVGRSAAEYGVAAAEMYLAGIGIVNEPLDWVLVVNDVAEGHYSSIAAALPFVPRGIIAGGRKLKIKNRSGDLLETFETAEKLDAAKSLYSESDLRVMGVTMEQNQFKDFLRTALANAGGPIPVPKDRNGLKKAMEAAGPKPAFNVKAHHDFPWAKRVWFASRGVDVNSPAFGRWVSEIDHKFWHERAIPKFNKFWEDFIDAEASLGRSYTMDEILQKLSEARSSYPVTTGN